MEFLTGQPFDLICIFKTLFQNNFKLKNKGKSNIKNSMTHLTSLCFAQNGFSGQDHFFLCFQAWNSVQITLLRVYVLDALGVVQRKLPKCGSSNIT